MQFCREYFCQPCSTAVTSPEEDMEYGMGSCIGVARSQVEVHTEGAGGKRNSRAENRVVPTSHQQPSRAAEEEEPAEGEKQWLCEEEDKELEFPHDLLPSIDLSSELNLWGSSLGSDPFGGVKDVPEAPVGPVRPLLAGLPHNMDNLSPPVAGVVKSPDDDPVLSSAPLQSRSLPESEKAQIPLSSSEDLEVQAVVLSQPINEVEKELPIAYSLTVGLPVCDVGHHGDREIYSKEATATGEEIFSFKNYILGNEEGAAEGSGGKDSTMLVPSTETETEKLCHVSTKADSCVKLQEQAGPPPREIENSTSVQDNLSTRPSLLKENQTELHVCILENTQMTGLRESDNDTEQNSQADVQLGALTGSNIDKETHGDEQTGTHTQLVVTPPIEMTNENTAALSLTEPPSDIQEQLSPQREGDICPKRLYPESGSAQTAPSADAPRGSEHTAEHHRTDGPETVHPDDLSVAGVVNDKFVMGTSVRDAVIELDCSGRGPDRDASEQLGPETCARNQVTVLPVQGQHESDSLSEVTRQSLHGEDVVSFNPETPSSLDQEENIFKREENTATLFQEKRQRCSDLQEKVKESALEGASSTAAAASLPLTTPTMPEMIESEGERENGRGELNARTLKAAGAAAERATDSPSPAGQRETFAARTLQSSPICSEIHCSPAPEVPASDTASEEGCSSSSTMPYNSEEKERKGGGPPANRSPGTDSLSPAEDSEPKSLRSEGQVQTRAASAALQGGRGRQEKSPGRLKKEVGRDEERGTSNEEEEERASAGGGEQTSLRQPAGPSSGVPLTRTETRSLKGATETSLEPQHGGELVARDSTDLLPPPQINSADAGREAEREKVPPTETTAPGRTSTAEAQPEPGITGCNQLLKREHTAASQPYKPCPTMWENTGSCSNTETIVKAKEGGSFTQMPSASLPPLTVHESLHHPVTEAVFSFREFSAEKPEMAPAADTSPEQKERKQEGNTEELGGREKEEVSESESASIVRMKPSQGDVLAAQPASSDEKNEKPPDAALSTLQEKGSHSSVTVNNSQAACDSKDPLDISADGGQRPEDKMEISKDNESLLANPISQLESECKEVDDLHGGSICLEELILHENFIGYNKFEADSDAQELMFGCSENSSQHYGSSSVLSPSLDFAAESGINNSASEMLLSLPLTSSVNADLQNETSDRITDILQRPCLLLRSSELIAGTAENTEAEVKTAVDPQTSEKPEQMKISISSANSDVDPVIVLKPLGPMLSHWEFINECDIVTTGKTEPTDGHSSSPAGEGRQEESLTDVKGDVTSVDCMVEKQPCLSSVRAVYKPSEPEEEKMISPTVSKVENCISIDQDEEFKSVSDVEAKQLEDVSEKKLDHNSSAIGSLVTPPIHATSPETDSHAGNIAMKEEHDSSSPTDISEDSNTPPFSVPSFSNVYKPVEDLLALKPDLSAAAQSVSDEVIMSDCHGIISQPARTSNIIATEVKVEEEVECEKPEGNKTTKVDHGVEKVLDLPSEGEEQQISLSETERKQSDLLEDPRENQAKANTAEEQRGLDINQAEGFTSRETTDQLKEHVCEETEHEIVKDAGEKAQWGSETSENCEESKQVSGLQLSHASPSMELSNLSELGEVSFPSPRQNLSSEPPAAAEFWLDEDQPCLVSIPRNTVLPQDALPELPKKQWLACSCSLELGSGVGVEGCGSAHTTDSKDDVPQCHCETNVQKSFVRENVLDESILVECKNNTMEEETCHKMEEDSSGFRALPEGNDINVILPGPDLGKHDKSKDSTDIMAGEETKHEQNTNDGEHNQSKPEITSDLDIQESESKSTLGAISMQASCKELHIPLPYMASAPLLKDTSLPPDDAKDLQSDPELETEEQFFGIYCCNAGFTQSSDLPTAVGLETPLPQIPEPKHQEPSLPHSTSDCATVSPMEEMADSCVLGDEDRALKEKVRTCSEAVAISHCQTLQSEEKEQTSDQTSDIKAWTGEGHGTLTTSRAEHTDSENAKQTPDSEEQTESEVKESSDGIQNTDSRKEELMQTDKEQEDRTGNNEKMSANEEFETEETERNHSEFDLRVDVLPPCIQECSELDQPSTTLLDKKHAELGADFVIQSTDATSPQTTDSADSQFELYRPTKPFIQMLRDRTAMTAVSTGAGSISDITQSPVEDLVTIQLAEAVKIDDRGVFEREPATRQCCSDARVELAVIPPVSQSDEVCGYHCQAEQDLTAGLPATQATAGIRALQPLESPDADLEFRTPTEEAASPVEQHEDEQLEYRSSPTPQAERCDPIPSSPTWPEDNALPSALPAHLFQDAAEFPTPPPTPPDRNVPVPESPTPPPESELPADPEETGTPPGPSAVHVEERKSCNLLVRSSDSDGAFETPESTTPVKAASPTAPAGPSSTHPLLSDDTGFCSDTTSAADITLTEPPLDPRPPSRSLSIVFDEDKPIASSGAYNLDLLGTSDSSFDSLDRQSRSQLTRSLSLQAGELDSSGGTNTTTTGEFDRPFHQRAESFSVGTESAPGTLRRPKKPRPGSLKKKPISRQNSNPESTSTKPSSSSSTPEVKKKAKPRAESPLQVSEEQGSLSATPSGTLRRNRVKPRVDSPPPLAEETTPTSEPPTKPCQEDVPLSAATSPSIPDKESPVPPSASYKWDPDNFEGIDPFCTGGSKIANSPVLQRKGIEFASEPDPLEEPPASEPPAPPLHTTTSVEEQLLKKRQSIRLEFDYSEEGGETPKDTPPPPKRVGKKPGAKMPLRKPKTGIKKAPQHQTEMLDNAPPSTNDDDIPIPKASYNFDPSQWDDPNFNPFSSGSGIPNSPRLSKGGYSFNPESFEEIDPFKSSIKMSKSPPKSSSFDMPTNNNDNDNENIGELQDHNQNKPAKKKKTPVKSNTFRVKKSPKRSPMSETSSQCCPVCSSLAFPVPHSHHHMQDPTPLDPPDAPAGPPQDHATDEEKLASSTSQKRAARHDVEVELDFSKPSDLSSFVNENNLPSQMNVTDYEIEYMEKIGSSTPPLSSKKPSLYLKLDSVTDSSNKTLSGINGSDPNSPCTGSFEEMEAQIRAESKSPVLPSSCIAPEGSALEKSRKRESESLSRTHSTERDGGPLSHGPADPSDLPLLDRLAESGGPLNYMEPDLAETNPTAFAHKLQEELVLAALRIEALQVAKNISQSPSLSTVSPQEREASSPAETTVSKSALYSKTAYSESESPYLPQDLDHSLGIAREEIVTKEKEVLEWKRKYEESRQEVVEMRRIVAEYEKTIAQMIGMPEDEKREKSLSHHTIQQLIMEKDQALADLNSVEKSLADLFRRYEKMKDVLEGFRKNEEVLKKCAQEYLSRVRKEEQRYQALKIHAEEKLDKASADIAQVRAKAKQEQAAYQASLRKEQMKVDSLERTLEQKNKEIEELTKICDELIAKMGKS
ncbi:uncharacterized protein tacc2 isoform X5 [Denticeps clupeoides]|uniref:uncharacterized protein tacc2 isoform X5 n=1 Tax=Denticeps clupeoides TaxID=299321 RepID=UPI0010A3454C|nr:uncharacterized protein LOC114795354 isoform X5 [Denticeps clupeoides]